MASSETYRSIELILTSACNLSCAYCYQRGVEPRAMSRETLDEAVGRAIDAPGRGVEIRFYGGEPLLEFDLVRRAVAAVERRRPPEKAVRFELVTNGTQLDDERIDFLADHAVRTNISFDGVPAAQELRAAGTFETLDRAFERIRRRRPGFFRRKVRACITLQPAAVTSLADSVDYFLAAGVREIAIAPCITGLDGWNPGGIEELDEQFARIFAASLRHYEERVEIPVLLLRKTKTEKRERPRSRPMCGALSGDGRAVDVDGRAYGCSLLAPSLRPESGEGDLPEDVFRNKEKKRSSYRKCADCPELDRCYVCPVSIVRRGDGADPDRVPDFLCAFNLVSLKHRDRFPYPRDPVEVLFGARPLSEARAAD